MPFDYKGIGQRTGSCMAIIGPVAPCSEMRLRHRAVAGSKKQSASGPTCNFRARLPSIVCRRGLRFVRVLVAVLDDELDVVELAVGAM